MTVEVTELAEEHESSLRALFVAEGMGPHAEALLDHRYRPYERLYVALAGSAVVGFVEGMFTDREIFGSGEFPPPRARIVQLVVAVHSRRTGIGSALVGRFAIDAEATRLDSLVLYPEPDRADVRRAFFHHCGMRPVTGTPLLGARLDTIRTALVSRS
ncbi:GNAT family N-acetyltransferase [Streptomyces hirsutus]|uniref:GNAT family N-acetyltransferase n=1 Tax=Streptomyces hirsutus TaxID=35620 RepID=UPI0036A2A27D